MSQENSEPLISRGQSLFITTSSIISAGSTFLVTWLAARSLTVEDNKDFLVFWSLTSLVFATLLGVQQESARLIGSARLTASSQQSGEEQTYRPILLATGVGLTCALIFLLFTPLWLNRVLPPDAGLTVLLIALTAVAYACQTYSIGAMSGLRAWTEYALLISTGGIFCFAATLLASALGAGLWAFQLAYLATAFLWIFFVPFSKQTRKALRLTLRGSWQPAYRSMILSVGTALAIASVSTGFPIFLEATSSRDTSQDIALLAAIILGISITRAPIMIPLQTFQGVAVSYFLNHLDRPLTALVKPILGLLATGLLGAVAAYFLGPWLFGLLYPSYTEQLSGFFLGSLTFAAALLAVTTLTGTAALSIGAHRTYLAGWVLTLVLAFACLLLPLGLEAKTLLALTLSPLLGACLHLVGIQALSQREKAV